MNINYFLWKKKIYQWVSFAMVLVFILGLVSLERTIPHKILGKMEQRIENIVPESAIPVVEGTEEKENLDFISEKELSPQEKEETLPQEKEEKSSQEKEEKPLQEKEEKLSKEKEENPLQEKEEKSSQEKEENPLQEKKEKPSKEKEEKPLQEKEEKPSKEKEENPLQEKEENPLQEKEEKPSKEKEEKPLQEKEEKEEIQTPEEEGETPNIPEEKNDTDQNQTEGLENSISPEDDSQLQIVTNLQNQEITYSELENDIFHFYAYLKNGNGKTLKVKLDNSVTPENGKYLMKNGENYHVALSRNESNFITLYVKDENKTVQEITYSIRYVPQKADEHTPTVGENPPTIVTNLENVEQLSNRNFTFYVEATTYTGTPLYASNIEVRLNGNRITNPTGGPRYEYQFYFENPKEGDVVKHTVTVRAWDQEGNSTFVIYDFEYHFVDLEEEIGTAYVILDATTVGLGILEEPYTYTIKQNVPASYAVMEMLNHYGYEFHHAGTADVGFYLQRIQHPGLMDYPQVPEMLWNKILKDELNVTGQVFSDSLGEFDYTQGSGWMFTVGGEVYEGKGLSQYYLNDGETLYVRFTLAYGKDIGGYTSTGGEFGKLSTYCGKWINGEYIDQHQWGEKIRIKEASCTQEGIMSCVCSVCQDQKETEIIPILEHSFLEIERKEPTLEEVGFVVYKCERCGEEKREEIPCLEEEKPSSFQE